MDDFHLGLEQELPRLRRYAYGLARNKALADDLVQDTYSRAIDKAHLWQPGTNLRGWLFTIMHNQNANAIRRAVRGQANVDLVVQFKRMVPDNVSNRIAIERSGS